MSNTKRWRVSSSSATTWQAHLRDESNGISNKNRWKNAGTSRALAGCFAASRALCLARCKRHRRSRDFWLEGKDEDLEDLVSRFVVLSFVLCFFTAEEYNSARCSCARSVHERIAFCSRAHSNELNDQSHDHFCTAKMPFQQLEDFHERRGWGTFLHEFHVDSVFFFCCPFLFILFLLLARSVHSLLLAQNSVNQPDQLFFFFDFFARFFFANRLWREKTKKKEG